MKSYTVSLILLVILSGFTSVYASDGWKTDFESASAEAKKLRKHVLINFTGSDWCGWCIRLKDEVFSQAAFKSYADDKLILVEIDFPSRKQQSKELISQNEKLLTKYSVEGFPTILVLDPDGKLIATTGYKEGGASVYIDHLREIIGE